MPNNENSGILIYAQLTREEYIHTVFFELVDKAKELAQKLGGTEVKAVLISRPHLIDSFKESFQNMGLSKVYYFESEELKEYSTEYHSKLIVDLVQNIKPEILLIGATNQGRDLAPRVASALGTGLTADCTGLDINEKGQLAATRPTFGGQLMATILCKNYPQMATVRPNVFKVNSFKNCNRKTIHILFISKRINEKKQQKLQFLLCNFNIFRFIGRNSEKMLIFAPN